MPKLTGDAAITSIIKQRLLAGHTIRVLVTPEEEEKYELKPNTFIFAELRLSLRTKMLTITAKGSSNPPLSMVKGNDHESDNPGL